MTRHRERDQTFAQVAWNFLVGELRIESFVPTDDVTGRLCRQAAG